MKTKNEDKLIGMVDWNDLPNSLRIPKELDVGPNMRSFLQKSVNKFLKMKPRTLQQFTDFMSDFLNYRYDFYEKYKKTKLSYNVDNVEDCVICLEPVNENLYQIPCGHQTFLHKECFKKWAVTNIVNNTLPVFCPLCKRDIPLSQYFIEHTRRTERTRRQELERSRTVPQEDLYTQLFRENMRRLREQNELYEYQRESSLPFLIRGFVIFISALIVYQTCLPQDRHEYIRIMGVGLMMMIAFFGIGELTR